MKNTLLDLSMISCFEAGFARCAKVIVSAENYDELISFDKSRFEIIKKAVEQKDYKNAVSLLRFQVEKKVIKLFEIEADVSAVFYGKTKNNLRELQFFREKMKFLPLFKIQEISICNKFTDQKSIIEILEKLNPSFQKILERYTCSYFLLRQFLNYVHGFLSFYFSIKLSQCNLRMLVVANDHSPAQVAASAAFKFFGLKRVYLQHAAITKKFPELDFDYAILNDNRSEEVYREIGVTLCEVLVIQRGGVFDESRWRNRLNSIIKAESVTVVLYLSAVFNVAVIRDFCIEIQRNPFINFGGIKYHPSANIIIDDYPKIEKIPEHPHVAIIGNSSVALELVHAGNLVYLAPIDEISFDYYGFFGEQICSKIENPAALSSKFWLNDAAFFEGKEHSEAVLDRFSENFERQNLILRKIYIDSKQFGANFDFEERLIDEIILYPLTYFRLASKYKDIDNSDLQLVKAYDSLFAKRILPLNHCLNYIDFSTIISLSQFWFLVKKIEWSGYKPNEKNISELTCFLIRLGSNAPKVLAWAESKMFAVMLRHSAPNDFVEFLRHTRTINLERLNPNLKVALIRYMDKFPEIDFENIYNDITSAKALHGLARLKVAIQSKKYDLFLGLGNVTHYSVEKHYCELIPKDLLLEYEKYVFHFYQLIKNQSEYIDINHSSMQKNELVLEITEALKSKNPFSLLRLGDGEGYFFSQQNNPESLFSIDDSQNRERHWWGEEIPVDLRSRIIKLGIQSILTANVIGVPTIFRFLRDTGTGTKSFISSMQMRGMFSVLEGIRGMDLESVKFTDSQLNVSLFSDLDVLNTIAAAADRVLIVNGAKREHLISISDALSDAVCIEVPTHAKQKENDKYFAGDRSFPFVFDDLMEEMLTFVKPGTLVLVGAGVIGKAFVSAAREAGGCALDIGSAFDQLTGAGIHSLY